MFDFWQEIYGTIKRNKLRTFLTGFSVAWGIFILIVLLGAGNGLIHSFDSNTEGLSLNSISVFPGTTSMPYKGLSIGRNIQFYNNDVSLLSRDFSKNIIDAGAVINVGSLTMSYGEEYLTSSFCGVSPNYTKGESQKVTKGRFINSVDIQQKRKVAVIRYTAAETLFPHNENPIGKFVNVDGLMYMIVGVYTDKGDDSSSGKVFIPFTAAQTVYCKGDSISNIYATTKGLRTKADNDKFEKAYLASMGKVHKFDPLDDSALWIWNRFKMFLQQQQASNIIKTAIWIIGIFTLLSGIVGVSNIMLITVRERTREFGIRKALGAKPSSILKLIIMESVTITTLFGYIGMFLGIAATEYMNLVAGEKTVDVGVFSQTVFVNPTVDISVAIEATLTLIIAGTLAGFFPARKATKIQPVEALKAE